MRLCIIEAEEKRRKEDILLFQINTFSLHCEFFFLWLTNQI